MCQLAARGCDAVVALIRDPARGCRPASSPHQINLRETPLWYRPWMSPVARHVVLQWIGPRCLALPSYARVRTKFSLSSNDTLLFPDDLAYSTWPCEHAHWCHPACPCYVASLRLHSWLSPRRSYSPLEVGTRPARALAPRVNYV